MATTYAKETLTLPEAAHIFVKLLIPRPAIHCKHYPWRVA